MIQSYYKYLNQNDRQSQQYALAKSKYLIVAASKDASINQKGQHDFDYKASQNDTDEMGLLFKIKKIKSPKQIINFNKFSFENIQTLLISLQGLFIQPDCCGSLVYYNGHGDKEGNWLLQCMNDQTQKVELVKFQLSNLLTLWEKRASNMKHLFLIMDSCYAGKWVENLKNQKSTSVSILSACNSSEPTFLIDGFGSYFTNYLLWTFVESFARKQKHLLPHKNLHPCSYSYDYSILKSIFNFEIRQEITSWQDFDQIHQYIIEAPKEKTQGELQCVLKRLGFPESCFIKQEALEEDHINPFQEQYLKLNIPLTLDFCLKMQGLSQQRSLFQQKMSFKVDMDKSKDPITLQTILKQISHLEYISIDLSSCQIDQKLAATIANCVVEYQNAISIDIDLSQNELKGQIFQVFCIIFTKLCKTLKELFINFNWNYIQNDSILPLISVFQSQGTLESLSLGLSQNEIGDESMSKVFSEIRQMVRLNQLVLHISNTQIGNETLKSLAESLQCLQNLEGFKLIAKWNQKISTEGIRYLVTAIKGKTNIKELILDFEFNSIDDQGAKEIKDMIDSLKNIENCEINAEANQISDQLLLEIKNSLKQKNYQQKKL
ncbi:hypothetical protein ABPG72_011300 [Tetrahymena utriculariae]